MEKMGHKNLPDFSLVHERERDSGRSEYYFKLADSALFVFIEFGLYQSVKDAQDVAKKIVTNLNAYYQEGPHQGVAIGDKLWWYLMRIDDPNILEIIVFTRKTPFLYCTLSYMKT